MKAIYHFELALKTKTIFLYSDDVYDKLNYFIPVVPLVNKRGRDEKPLKDRVLNLCYSHYILSVYEKLNLYKENVEIYNNKDIGFTKDNPAAVFGSNLRDFLEHSIFDNIIGENGNIIVNFSTTKEKFEGEIYQYDVMLIDKDYKLTKATLYFYKKYLSTSCFNKNGLKKIKRNKIYLPFSFNYKRFNEKALDVVFINNKRIYCFVCGEYLGFGPDKHICKDRI